MFIIDNGRENTKVLPEEGEPFSFPSKVGEAEYSH